MKKILLFLTIAMTYSISGLSQCHIATQDISIDFNSTADCWSFTARNNIAENFTGLSGGVLRMIPKHIGSLAVLPRVYNGSGILSFDIQGLGAYQVGVMASQADGGTFIEMASGSINSSLSSARTFNFASYQGEYDRIAIVVTSGGFSNANISIDDLTYTSGCPSNEFAVFNVNENISVSLDEAGNGTLDVADVDVSSVTTCGNELSSLSLDVTSFTCADIGVNNVNLTAVYNGNTVGIESIPVTIEDNIAPAAVGQNISVNIDVNTGLGIITPAMVENGSSDNCTSTGALVKTLSKTIFRCEDTGDNIVTYSVEDASGNAGTADVTVTVTSVVVDETVTTANGSFCPDGSAGATISTGSSQVGFNYSLRNSLTNAVVDGPYAGTGNAMDFSTGNLSETTTFNIFTEKVRSTTQSALEFDGVNDYVDFGASNRNIATQTTIAAWVKTATTELDFLVAKYDGSNGILLFVDANGKAKFDGRDGSGSYRSSGASTTSINDNEWHYIVGTADISTGNWRIYVDGVQENGVNYSAGTTLESTTNLYFGGFSANFFPGSIDQVTIWNTELSGSEISTNFNSCLAGSATGVVGHFVFEDGSGTTLTDQSALVADGTLIGMDDADWIQVISPSCAEKICDYQMTTEVTVGDNTAPIAVAQNYTLDLGTTGNSTLIVANVDNGSSDNCTTAENLTLSLDKTEFTCDDIGTNTVTLTVADEEGNESTATVTVTVNSPINDETVIIAHTNLCPGDMDGTTVSLSGSVTGVNYYLRDSNDNSIIDGPIAGTGSAIDFATGSISETSVFNVFANIPKTNYSLDFDGIDDYIVSSVEESFDYSVGYTMEAWINAPLPGASAHRPIISIGNTFTSDVEIYVQANTNKLVVIHDRGEATFGGYSYTIPPADQWFHLAVTYDGSSIQVYFDGVLQSVTDDSYAPTGSLTKNGTHPFKIGLVVHSAFGAGAAFFDGQIDEIQVWDHARSESEILSDLSNCLEGDESGLSMYFDFDQGNGTSALDLANSNDGTMTNMDGATDWLSGAISCDSGTCGFQMTTDVSITIEDTEDPVAIAQDIIIQLDADGNATIEAADIDNGSSDNCSNLTLSIDQTDFDCTMLGANTVTFTANDGNGNESSAQVTVSVVDEIAPTIAAQNISVQLDASGNATVDVNSVVTSSSDNCTSSLTFALSQSVFDCSNIGENMVTLSATDESGNSSTQDVVITIEESGPTVITQNITIELDTNGEATITSADIDNGSSDDCTALGDLVMSLDVVDFSCEDIGTSTQVTLSVTDLNGNVSTGVATVTVVDIIAPTVLTQDITLVLDGNGEASITSADIDNGSSDNCTALGDLVMSLDVSSFDINDVGANTVNLSVTDASGNIATATATVTISDKEAQVATFTGVEDKTFGGANFDIAASVDSSLPVTYTVLSGGLSIASSTSNSATFTITGAGTASIEVTNDGDDTYAPFQETISINVAKADQVLTVEEITNKSVAAQPFNVNASVDTDLALDYAVSGPASNSGNVITLDGTLGTVSVTVSQAGTDNYNTVSETISFDVVDKQTQTISFTNIPDVMYGVEDQALSATASSTLAVTFNVVSGPAVLTGNILSITGVGTIVVEALQAGDGDFVEASAQQTFTVSQASLVVTADDLSITYGDAIPALTYQYDGFVNGETVSDLIAEPAISTDVTTLSDAGTYPILLAGGEAANYTITLVDAILTINKVDQIITIDPITDKQPTDATFDVAATVDSGLELTYEVTGPATISGSTLTLDGTEGTVTVTVSQAGDNNRNAASASTSFEVALALAIGDELSEAVKIYPNPVTEYIMIDLDELVDLRFYGLNGQLIKEFSQVNGRVDVSSMKMGTYLMQVSNSEEQITLKINKAN